MKNRINSLPNTWYDVLYLATFAILLVVNLRISIMTPTINFMDMFYNYAGGFIRRGLGGEIMFWANDHLGIPPLTLFLIVTLGAYAALAYVLARLLRYRGYGLNVVILPVVLGGVLTFPLDVFRRDFVVLVLFAIVALTWRRMEWRRWCIVGNLLIVFGILLHEATFFFTVPILVLMTNLRCKGIVKAAACWLPSIIAFFICCYYKGTPEMIQPIVAKAAEYYPQGFEDGKTPWLLTFIGKDSADTFLFHIHNNFTSIVHRVPIPSLFYSLFHYVYFPYMTIAMLRAFSPKGLNANAASSLVRIICFQFISLLPMWTILSCDTLRVGIYWIVTSLLVWLILEEDEMAALFKRRYNNAVDRATTRLYPYTRLGRLPLTIIAFSVGITLCISHLKVMVMYSFGYRLLLTGNACIKHLLTLL